MLSSIQPEELPARRLGASLRRRNLLDNRAL